VLEEVLPVGAGDELVASPHLVHPLFELLGLLQWSQKKPTEGDQLALLLLKVPPLNIWFLIDGQTRT